MGAPQCRLAGRAPRAADSAWLGSGGAPGLDDVRLGRARVDVAAPRAALPEVASPTAAPS